MGSLKSHILKHSHRWEASDDAATGAWAVVAWTPGRRIGWFVIKGITEEQAREVASLHNAAVRRARREAQR